MVDRLGDAVTFYKVGLELIFAGGIDFARAPRAVGQARLPRRQAPRHRQHGRGRGEQHRGARHDLPHHPRLSARRCGQRSPARGRAGLKLLGVTVLTSMDDGDVAEAGYAGTACGAGRASRARTRAQPAWTASSPRRPRLPRSGASSAPTCSIVTPGIRPAGRRSGRPEADRDARLGDRRRGRLSGRRPADHRGRRPERGGGGDRRRDRSGVGGSRQGVNMAKGYWIAHIDVTDNDGYAPYVAANPAIFREIRRPLPRSRRQVRGDGRDEPLPQRGHRIPRLCLGARLLSIRPNIGANTKQAAAPIADIIVVEGYDGPQPLTSAGDAPAIAARPWSPTCRLVVAGAAGRMGRTLVARHRARRGRDARRRRRAAPMRPISARIRASSPGSARTASRSAPIRCRLRQGRRRARLHHAGGDRRLRRLRRAGAHRPCHRHHRAFGDATRRLSPAPRARRIVKSGNMSLGVNLLAVARPRRRRKRSTPTSTSRSSRCIIATRSTRRPARRSCSARRRRKGAASTSPSTRCAAATAIPGRAGAATSASPRCAAARWSATTVSSSPARAR